MENEHHELQKRESIEAGSKLKLHTRTKRTRGEENLVYVDQDDTPRAEDNIVDTEMNGSNSHSIELEMASANKYLDSMLNKITRKLMGLDLFDSIVEPSDAETPVKREQASVNIVFDPNRGRKMVFNKKGSLQIAPKARKNNIEDFNTFVNDRFDRIRINLIKGVYVYYADFVDAVDKTVNEVFYHFKIDYNKDFFKSYYSFITEGIETYKQKKLHDINTLYDHWPELRLSTEKFPRYPLQTRKYYNIDNYESALEANEKENINGIYNLENLLKSDVKPSCEANCSCNNKITEYCKISQFREFWETQCNDKRSNIECDDSCGCDFRCKNRALQTHDMKELSKNIEVKLAWGIDLATRQSICFLMPAYLNFEGQIYYMDKIINTLNDFGYEGWNITNTFEKLAANAAKNLIEYKKSQRMFDSPETTEPKNDFEILLTNETSNSTCNSRAGRNGNNSTDDIVVHIDRAMDYDINETSTFMNPYNCNEYSSSNFAKEDSKTIKSIISSQLSNPYTDYKQQISKLEQLEQELEVYSTLLKYSKISQVRAALRVHSKGLGVVCNKQTGIEKNSLVVRYIGEVYPVWYWCMKQDIIKSFFSMIKKDKCKKFAQYKNNYNIDFYNIMLEKNSKEPKGKDIVVVDPIIKGNFASRLSHSCDPNCMAFPVISNGQYSIAMYAIRDIAYHEELTFDYCSITESEQEYKSSICLCGTLHCKGHYLGFTKKHLDVFTGDAKRCLIDDASNSFLRNNANILQACETSFTDSKREELLRFCIGENTFKDSPEWLKNWSYYVLKTIKKEKNGLIKEVLGVELEDEEIEIGADVKLSEAQVQTKFEIDTLFSQRITNLVISIDKLRHFITRQDPASKSQLPLQMLGLDQHIGYVSDILSIIFESKDALDAELKNKIKAYTKGNMPGQQVNDSTFVQQFGCPKVRRLIQGKLLLLETSYCIREKSNYYTAKHRKHGTGCQPETLQALSDILYLMAFTVVCFTSNVYDGFSLFIDVRECDLTSAKRTFSLNLKPEEEQLVDLSKPITNMEK